ncbi:hypothetical protein LJC15_01370 [Desulfovibrio sp. OttesenSCG-928-G11]|nr:hypothetical protein [Desulfovibrio sp. OttesenSCG-928-G11]
MNYPTDLCQLVIRNMEVIEKAPEVAEATEKRLFAAVNARIEKAVKAQKGWKGCYDVVTDKEEEETTFAPQGWPENNEEDGVYEAYYTLTYTHSTGGEPEYWLSCATGIMGAALCFAFAVDFKWFDLRLTEYKKMLESFYADKTALQKHKFSLAANKESIIRAFIFNADALAAEYPDFDEALAPLDEALQDLFKVHAEFDKFVTGLSKKRG